MVRTFIVIGALSAAAAIGLGAFGAHALRATLAPRMLEIYHTAVFYHLTHSLGLFAAAFVCSLKPHSRLARAAGLTMLAGLLLFSGSLYLLAISSLTALGAVTPLGGTALIVAWLMLALAASGK
ncbi:MAG: DUF423 domain-containing protein [Desulfobacterales bacterium]|nr:DUF423 domain-containing protein [Desulfobacterales bacterium]